jgi:predicted RecA/RadA family phage recombinase
MQNFVQRPDHIHAVIADTVKGGDVVAVGSVLGVAECDGDGVNLVAVATTGVVRLPKATGALTQGAKVYWDADAKNITTTATDNTAIGFVWTAVESGDTEVEVALANGI